MKVGEAVAEIMKREGIEILCGYPVNHLLEYAAAADIRPIIVRQERIGLHMADAISRVTSGRKIGAFCMQHGPGTENAYGGIAQSYSESVPVLVVPQGYPQRIAHIDPNYSAVREMRGVAKSAEPLVVANELSNIMRRAFSRLRNGRGGPCIVEIPDRPVGRRHRPARLYAGYAHPHCARSGRCAQGRGSDPRSEATGDLRRHGCALVRGLAAASRLRRTARRAGHHQPRRQERVPGEPSAVARFRRQRGAEAGTPLHREQRPDHRHRLLIHRDELRHQVPQGQEVHPRDARPRSPEQGRARHRWPAGRCGAGARGAHR